MVHNYDLAGLSWTIAGYTPTSWQMGRVLEQAIPCVSEITPVAATVPGSVHQALRNAGVLPDWNVKLNSCKCEWVDHRDWIFSVEIPRHALEGERRSLRCLGLDGYGLILFNRTQVGSFRNGYVPHAFDLCGVALQEVNRLEIIFTDLPRFNGTPNISSQIRDLKARFNYTWDWMPRNVQIGIWDDLWIELDANPVLEGIRISARYDIATATGALTLQGAVPDDATLAVSMNGVVHGMLPASELRAGVTLPALKVEPWQCNGRGRQHLYSLRLELTGSDGSPIDHREERIGFKQIAWLACEGAPAEADPWICELNGEKVFLVGVNWTPIRAYYADVTEADYRKRLEAYRDIGFNVLRVWGGAFLEKEIFYRLCDEMGFLVWQEFPLSSSGPDNEPPTDPATIKAWGETARSYIKRRRHHACLFIWCGGNELQTCNRGTRGIGRPLTVADPMLGHFAGICAEEDPQTRYLPCSASGPTFVAEEKDFGKGVHWDVHGPWRIESEIYWQKDDALFRSETGAPGASSMDIINQYYPDCDLLPVTEGNPYWRRFFWWIDEAGFVEGTGRKPESIEEYVAWSQEHQALALTRALSACRNRFPAIGGFILWMGHDSFPCLANTSILDFHGNPKPAAIKLQQILQKGRLS
ncbi:MAG: glycosyl hydrolase 2 galactose-binding domain-containing protein [Alsobacter sp.]